MQNCTAVDEALHKHLGLETSCFVEQLLPQLVDLVRASRRLPLGEEHAIRRGSREFLDASKELGRRTLGAAHKTLRYLDPAGHAYSKAEDLANFNLLVDSIDSVLERVDGCLRDAAAGIAAPSSPPLDGSPTASAGPLRSSSSAALGKSAIAKPQVRWRHLIDNDRTTFVPRLAVKHNQQAPLAPEIVEAQKGSPAAAPADDVVVVDDGPLASHLNSLGLDKREADRTLPHPYGPELGALSWPDSFFEVKRAERYGRVEDTPLIFVRTEEDLRSMIQEIKATCIGREIAVDLEHHDFRTYRGFTCLLQLSTRQKDFIVDPFDIFEQMHLLNEVFTDPRIVKVLHGADRDIQWLQRDFSVYVVNMFDTGQATRELRLQGGFSLANLISFCCGLKLDKKYQTADWRERPLPAEMVQYARSDTHYLLYCYDCMKNALLSQVPNTSTEWQGKEGQQATEAGVAALQAVLDRSTAICRQQYAESPLDAGTDAMRLRERFGSKQKPLEPRQFAALKALVEWRDRLARSLDESLNFISPDACLWRIALALPTTTMRLRSTCNPLPATLERNSQEIVELVLSSGSETKAAGAAPSAAPRGGASAGDSGTAASSSMMAAAAAAESVRQEAVVPARRSAPKPKTRLWPVRASSSPLPVVHVVAAAGGDKAKGSPPPGGLCAVLSAMDDSESEQPAEAVLGEVLQAAAKPSNESSGRLAEILETMNFVTKPPEAVPDAAPPQEGQQPMAVEDDGQPEAATEKAEASLTFTGGRRKKRRRVEVPENLEKVAAAAAAASVAVTDPYAPGADGEPAQAEGEATEGPRRKKRKKVVKRVAAAGQTQVDPYL